MQKWEYSFQVAQAANVDIHKLTDAGESGWELVSAVSPVPGGLLLFYKRPKR